MKEINKNGELYAIRGMMSEVPKGKTGWYGGTDKAIQVAQFHYDNGKEFVPHRHILRPRLNNYTQECLLVIQGEIFVTIHDINRAFVATEKLSAFEFIILYQGYHGVNVTGDNTKFFEFKNGPFTTVKEDKELL